MAICEHDLRIVRRSASHEKLARLKTWKSFLGKARPSVVPRLSVCPGVLCSCASRPNHPTRQPNPTHSISPPIHVRLRRAFTKQSIDKLCTASPPFFRTQRPPNFSFRRCISARQNRRNGSLPDGIPTLRWNFRGKIPRTSKKGNCIKVAIVLLTIALFCNSFTRESTPVLGS